MSAPFNAPSWLGKFAANGGWIFPHETGFRAVIQMDGFQPEQNQTALQMVNQISDDATARKQIAETVRQLTASELDEMQAAAA